MISTKIQGIYIQDITLFSPPGYSACYVIVNIVYYYRVAEIIDCRKCTLPFYRIPGKMSGDNRRQLKKQ